MIDPEAPHRFLQRRRIDFSRTAPAVCSVSVMTPLM